ncbi:MAG: capsule assembly Wzi family protein [Muribaculaceae bacterium]|nr:capsule assembly Wzi family protein [Muribaculaceae bacterium]
MKYLLGLFLCCFPAMSAFSEKPDSLRYFGEIKADFSAGENTPFWLVNNLQGLGSPEKNNGYVRAGLFKDIKEENRFSWGAGIDLVGGWNLQSPFYIHQLYGEVKYRCLDALVGSKEIWSSFLDHNLSSGDLLYSGNALPVPQVRIGIFDYADFWGCKGWFAAKGYIAYGMFTDSKWQKSWSKPEFKHGKNILYHSKGLWLRGGNIEKFPLRGEIGIEMATQFGGIVYKDGKIIDLKPSFKDWLTAFFPRYQTRETFFGESTSIEGNMVGEYTIALEWQPKNSWGVRAYYEHYFDDQSQMTFEYGWKDGLYGIEVKFPTNRYISKFVYEFLYSKDQTGAVNNDSSEKVPEQVSGRDNYYNNSLYPGWQHWGMGFGNPLMLSPIYNANHKIEFYDTRIYSHHFGLEGYPMQDLKYRILLSFSRNWGTYACPYEEIKNNFDGLCEVTWKPSTLKGWYGILGIAGDSGDLIGKSFGASLTIGYAGSF